MHVPGFWQMLFVLAIVVLLFGGKKLPELGGALGETIKNFKKAIKDNDPTNQVAADKNDTNGPKV